MFSRSFALAKKVSTVQKSLSMASRVAKPARPLQDWSALLSSLDTDTRPIVIMSAAKPFSILAVNEAWVSLCGYSHSEVLGKSLAMLQGPSTDRDALREFMHRCTSGVADIQVVNYTKARRPFLNHVHAEAVDVEIDGMVTPMFVGALSFEKWIEQPVATPPSTTSARKPADEQPVFELFAALANSSKPQTPAQRHAQRTAPAYDLARLRSSLAF